MVKTCGSTHEISVKITYENEFSSREWKPSPTSLDLRLQKEQAEADEKKRRKEAGPTVVSHRAVGGRWGKVIWRNYQGFWGYHLVSKNCDDFFGTWRETHVWRFLLECQNWVGMHVNDFLICLDANRLNGRNVWRNTWPTRRSLKLKQKRRICVQQLGSLKWFSQGGVPPPPPIFFPPRTFQFSFGPTLGVSFVTC